MTQATKRYKSAPIVEAVLEIRVRPENAPTPQSIKKLGDSLSKDFPKQTPMRRLEVAIASSNPPEQSLSHSMSQAEFGLRLANSDDSRIVQVRHDGLAYSHMAPYTEWAIFRREAHAMWSSYRATCPDAKLARCALRYINRVDIPGTNIELFDYFWLYPQLPDQLPHKDVISMAMNLQMPQHDLECVAAINQALAEPVKANHVSVILDIDVYRLGIESWQDAQAWDFLDKLRIRKNEIFEACITDRTRELIDT